MDALCCTVAKLLHKDNHKQIHQVKHKLKRCQHVIPQIFNNAKVLYCSYSNSTTIF